MTLSISDIESKLSHKTIIRIENEPDFAQIRELQLAIEDNAASIDCRDGGGRSGYLWLTKTAAEWAVIEQDHPVEFPVHPDPLEITNNMRANEIIQAQETYKQQQTKYNDATNVKHVLTNQIINALEAKYTLPLRHTTTRRITKTIPEIFDYLYSTHGQVDSDEITNKEHELRTSTYDIRDPVSILFDKLDDFKIYTKAAGEEKSSEQIINLALTILRNSGEFEKGLGDWYSKDAAQKTWSNLKEHFQEEQILLRKIRGKSMKNTSFQNQVNFLSDQYKTDLTEIQKALASIVTQPSENEVTESSSKLDLILQELQTMKTEVNNLKNRTATKKQAYEDQGKRRWVISKYCHTCGASNHKSDKCKNKATGHKDDATFENKMGGSTLFCKHIK